MSDDPAALQRAHNAAIAARQREAGATEERVALAYRERLGWDHPNSRVLLADLASVCHAARSTEGATPAETSFRNGQRAVFLYIAGRLGLPILGA